MNEFDLEKVLFFFLDFKFQIDGDVVKVVILYFIELAMMEREIWQYMD